jgi:hypothetical protein
MSSYCKKAINPKTGKKQIAGFIDDFYGIHQYGVLFKKDGKNFGWGTINLEDYDAYRIEEVKED